MLVSVLPGVSSVFVDVANELVLVKSTASIRHCATATEGYRQAGLYSEAMEEVDLRPVLPLLLIMGQPCLS